IHGPASGVTAYSLFGSASTRASALVATARTTSQASTQDHFLIANLLLSARGKTASANQPWRTGRNSKGTCAILQHQPDALAGEGESRPLSGAGFLCTRIPYTDRANRRGLVQRPGRSQRLALPLRDGVDAYLAQLEHSIELRAAKGRLFTCALYFDE